MARKMHSRARLRLGSNPRRAFTLAGFQDRCIQPLCHLSGDLNCDPSGGSLRAARGWDGSQNALASSASPRFEPTKGFHPCWFSRPVHSTALPPLRELSIVTKPAALCGLQDQCMDCAPAALALRFAPGSFGRAAACTSSSPAARFNRSATSPEIVLSPNRRPVTGRERVGWTARLQRLPFGCESGFARSHRARLRLGSNPRRAFTLADCDDHRQDQCMDCAPMALALRCAPGCSGHAVMDPRLILPQLDRNCGAAWGTSAGIAGWLMLGSPSSPERKAASGRRSRGSREGGMADAARQRARPSARFEPGFSSESPSRADTTTPRRRGAFEPGPVGIADAARQRARPSASVRTRSPVGRPAFRGSEMFGRALGCSDLQGSKCSPLR